MVPGAPKHKGWVLRFSAQVPLCPSDTWDIPGFLRHGQAELQNT